MTREALVADPDELVGLGRAAAALIRLEDAAPRWLIVVVSLCGPILVGLALGAVVRHVLKKPLRGALNALLLATGPWLAAPIFAFDWIPMGFWDALTTLVLMSAGVLAVAHDLGGPAARRGRLAAAISVVASLGIGEVSARWLPPPLRDDQLGASEPLTLFASRIRSRYNERPLCAMAFPASSPARTAERLQAAGDGPARFLHVGDSMVDAGSRSSQVTQFVPSIDDDGGRVAHVVAAMSGSGPGTYLTAVTSWLALYRFERVYVYLFSGNDLDDLRATTPCCHLEPWLVDDGDRARPRCSRYEPTRDVTFWVAESPPPVFVRALRSHSMLAKQVDSTLRTLSTHIAIAFFQPVNEDALWTRLDHALEALHDQVRLANASLTFVLVPFRWALEGVNEWKDGDQAFRDAVTVAGRRLGVEVLDPWPAFADAVALNGFDSVFLDRPVGYYGFDGRDFHFNVEGNDLMAAWMSDHMPWRTRVQEDGSQERNGP